jgi:hypothetical protein
MANPRTRNDTVHRKPEDDRMRVDPFREDEDTGGDAAPPLFPYDPNPEHVPPASGDRPKRPARP